jgi:hypothetical protein
MQIVKKGTAVNGLILRLSSSTLMGFFRLEGFFMGEGCSDMVFVID